MAMRNGLNNFKEKFMIVMSNVKQFAKKHGKLLSIILIILTSIFIGALLTYMAVRQQVDDANEEIQ